MLLPQFSLRRFFIVVSVCTCLFLVGGFALQRYAWALGITVAIGSLVVAGLFYALIFGLVTTLGRLLGGRSIPARTSRGGIIPGTKENDPDKGKLTICIGWLAGASLWIGMSLVDQSAALAATGNVFHLPIAQKGPITRNRLARMGPSSGPTGGTAGVRYSSQSGLQLRVDTIWAAGRAYRPIRVSIRSPGPSPADRLLTIRIFAGSRNNQFRAIRVEQDFLLPTGATIVTATVAVPQLTTWKNIGWELWVDGVQDKPLSMQNVRLARNPSDSSTISTLIVRPTFDMKLESLLKQWTEDRVNLIQLSPSELPVRWIDYSGLDVILLTSSELLQIPEANPAAWSAILRWLRTGGNLLIYNLGDHEKSLPDIERVLPNDSPLADSSLANPGLPDSSLIHRSSRGWQPVRIFQLGDPMFYAGESPQVGTSAWLANSPFLWQTLGMGTICISRIPLEPAAENFQEQRKYQWTSMLEQFNWQLRHGFYPGTPCREFNNWLIPDVGTAPVTEFQLLISCFVLVIGPLNYWLLKRSQRLPLLLVTVPLTAIGVTLLLFAYGLMADGLGVQVRARSYTWLDQLAGESASWTRASYYAGLTPAAGLQFSQATTIYPLTPSWARNASLSLRIESQHRELLWDEFQQLSQGWLPSRMPTQYLLTAAQTTSRRLEIRASSSGWQVNNRLGTHVQTLFAVDPTGQVHWCENLASEQQSSLQPISHPKAINRLRNLFSPNDPQYPPGAEESFLNYGQFLSNNLMENHLTGIVTPGDVTKMIRPSLAPGTYVAITSTGPPMGIADATEVSSFHILQGIWKP